MWTRSCRLTDESQENSGIRVKSDDQELTEVGQWRLHSLSSQETLSPWSQHLTTGGSTCNCRVVTGVSESSPLIGQHLCYWAVIVWCQETPVRLVAAWGAWARQGLLCSKLGEQVPGSPAGLRAPDMTWAPSLHHPCLEISVCEDYYCEGHFTVKVS